MCVCVLRQGTQYLSKERTPRRLTCTERFVTLIHTGCRERFVTLIHTRCRERFVTLIHTGCRERFVTLIHTGCTSSQRATFTT